MYDGVSAFEENANSFKTVCYIIIIIIICIIIAFGPTAVGLNGLCRLGVASETAHLVAAAVPVSVIGL